MQWKPERGVDMLANKANNTHPIPHRQESPDADLSTTSLASCSDPGRVAEESYHSLP